MVDSHLIERALKSGKNSTMRLAKKPNGTAVVFIHGFSGNALATWSNFPEMFTDYREFSGCDIYFYGYDSIYTQTSNSATRFYEFLSELNTAPNKLITFQIPKSIERPLDFNYSKILIVAHSMGAIILRLALMYAYEEKNTWLDKNHMILFAPAHFGSKIPFLLKEAEGFFLPKIFKPLIIYYKYRAVTLTDLEENSDLLTDLETKTKKLQESEAGEFTIAKDVRWASEERVVVNRKYLKDCMHKIIEGTHTEICKPKEEFKVPIEIIVSHLK